MARSIFDETVEAHMASLSASRHDVSDPSLMQRPTSATRAAGLTNWRSRLLVLGENPSAEQSAELVACEDLPSAFDLLGGAETVCDTATISC